MDYAHIDDLQNLSDGKSDNDSGLTVEDIGSEELLSGSDEEMSDRDDLDIDNTLAYESDTLSEDLQTIEELLEDLQAHLGPETEEEFWKIRMLFLSYTQLDL